MTNFYNQYLIADSGGTKTDWCYVNSVGEKSFFTTESYHPVNWSDEFVQRITKFWHERDEMKSAELCFFGAGCMKDEKSEELETIFRNIGFTTVKVKSDLHAAGLTAFGSRDGTVAIMGTGSVLFNWKNGEVCDIVGGKGHLFGDEGSGFYFGKLVYDAYLNSELNEAQNAAFARLDLNETELQELNDNLKFALADLAFKLRDPDNYRDDELFASWHQCNFNTFCRTHFNDLLIRDICIIGSYAFHNQVILRTEFEKFNVNVKKIINKPIGHLVEQIVPFID